MSNNVYNFFRKAEQDCGDCWEQFFVVSVGEHEFVNKAIEMFNRHINDFGGVEVSPNEKIRVVGPIAGRSFPITGIFDLKIDTKLQKDN
jgi:hypothetical protein